MKVSRLEQALFETFPKVRGKYPEFKVCCPFCGEERYRLGINIKLKTGNCFNCGERLNGIRIAQMLNLTKGYAYEPNDLESFEKELDLLNQPRHVETLSPPQIDLKGIYMAEFEALGKPAAFEPTFQLASDYLSRRGFDPRRLAEEYALILPHRATRERDRLIIPTFENNNVVYYQARSLVGVQPKYLNPPKSENTMGKSHFVFNLQKASQFEEVVLCEGVFSAMAVGPNALAIFGKTLSEIQARKILKARVHRVTVLLDPGAEAEALEVAAMLGNSIEVKIGRLVSGDPNEVSKQELREVLETATVFDPLLHSILSPLY